MNIPNWQHHSKKEKHSKGTCKGRIRANKQRLRALKKRLYTKDPKGSFFIPNSIMTKLLVLPLMLASTAGIIGSTAAEAKPRMFHSNPGGNPGTIHRPRRRCTFKRPCSRMPELPFFPGEIQPMPRGGFRNR